MLLIYACRHYMTVFSEPVVSLLPATMVPSLKPRLQKWLGCPAI